MVIGHCWCRPTSLHLLAGSVLAYTGTRSSWQISGLLTRTVHSEQNRQIAGDGCFFIEGEGDVEA
jgi:hypothetical protein